MKKIYSLLIALLALVGVAQAQTITFTAGTDKYSAEAAGAHSLTKDGVTIAVSNGTLGRTDNYRVYKNQTLTVSSTVGDIIKIELTCTSSNPAGNFDAIAGFTTDGSNGVWTGSAASVTLTATTNQVRATKIEVTVKNADPNFVAPPTVSPDEGTYFSAQTVTLEAEEGATIYYTTDGSVPTTASTVYSAPFEIAETTNIKALAVKNGHESAVAEFAFDIQSVTTTTIANILTAGAAAGAQTSAIVVAAGNSGFLLGDGTGYIFAYTGAAPEVAVGDVVTVTGATAEYGGRLQFSQPTVVKTGTATVTYPTPRVIDGAAFDELVAAAPTMEYVQFEASVSAVGTYYNFKISGATNNASIVAPQEILSQLAVGQTVTITGFFAYVTGNNTKYGYVVATDVQLPEITYTEFNSFSAAKAAATATDEAAAVNAQLNVSEALVTFVNGQDVYLFDGQDGMLVHGTNSKNLKAGDKISGTVKGKLYKRYGNIQISNPLYDVEKVSSDNEVVAQEVSPAAFNANGATYENELITLSGLVPNAQTLENKIITFKYEDEEEEINYTFTVYDNFGVAADMAFDKNKAYTVTGFVALYTNKEGVTTVQIYPRSTADLDNGEVQPTYEFVGNGTLENPYTVADIQHKDATDTKTALEEDVWVKAFIVGYINGSSLSAATAMFTADAPEGTDKEGKPLTVTASNILVANANSASAVADVIPVQLPNGAVREGLNLGANPSNLGQQVWLHGDIIKYMGMPGLKNVDGFSFDGVNFTAIHDIAAENAVANKSIYTIAGQRVQNLNKRGLYIVNGKKVVVK